MVSSRTMDHGDAGLDERDALDTHPYAAFLARMQKPGRYLGGDWQLRSALTISGAFANDPLPITITQTTKVTALE